MERTLCIECNKRDARYWDKSYCEECYIEVLEEPKKNPFKSIPQAADPQHRLLNYEI